MTDIVIFVVYNLLDSHNALFIYIFPKVERSIRVDCMFLSNTTLFDGRGVLYTDHIKSCITTF